MEQTVTEQNQGNRRIPTAPAYPWTAKSLSGLEQQQGINDKADPAAQPP